MRYLFDTNTFSALVRHPRGVAAETIAKVGKDAVYTSVVAAAELRYGAAKKGSGRLTAQVEAVLAVVNMAAWSPPCDRIYADLQTYLEREGTPIGGNDLLIGSHALADENILVTDNTREFGRIPGLKIENWLRP